MYGGLPSVRDRAGDTRRYREPIVVSERPLHQRQRDRALGDQKTYVERTRHPRSDQLTFVGLTSEIANDADELSDRPDA